MKRISLICIVGGSNELFQKIFDYVKKDIPGEWKNKYKYIGRGALELPLEEGSKSYQYVMEMAKKHALHPSVFQISHYTKSEIEEAEYFRMDVMYPLELEGTEASDYGTQYTGGCPNPKCRLGKKLVGDVLVDRKFMKKWDIGTLLPDIYVSERLAGLIREEGLTGISAIGEVRDFKGREMPKYYVVEIEHILPPMAESAWLVSDDYHPMYKDCEHQVVYLRSDVQYERGKLVGAKDFNLSTEYIDNYRLRVLIVSAKVRNLFKQNKVHARFSPVAILE